MSTKGIHAIMSGEARGLTPTCCRAGLWLLSLLYGLGARAKNLLFDIGIRKATRVTRPDGSPLPIICIGNLSTGGTGKTPMVELAVRELQEMGKKPGILSRGYGGGGHANDEALMLAESLPGVPHIQNPDRIAGAQELAKSGVDVIVMDDGFSHRRLARDIDILLFDATNPFGHGYLLPRGLLREPIKAAKRSQMAVITRSDAVTSDELRAVSRRLVSLGMSPERILTATHLPMDLRPVQPGAAAQSLSGLNGRPVFAVCGIGNPAAFHRTLRDLGANIVGNHDLPDHFEYSREWFDTEWPNLMDRATSSGANAIVVTQKDAVKLRARLEAGGLPVLQLNIRMSLDALGSRSLTKILNALFVTHS